MNKSAKWVTVALSVYGLGFVGRFLLAPHDAGSAVPDGVWVILLGTAVVFTQPFVRALFIKQVFVGHTVHSRYVRRFHGRWSYWVQVDRKGWIEDIRVDYDVYRVLKQGDVFSGSSRRRYPLHVMNRTVPERLADQEAFEEAMTVSQHPFTRPEDRPLNMEVMWVVGSRGRDEYRKPRPCVYRVDEWNNDAERMRDDEFE